MILDELPTAFAAEDLDAALRIVAEVEADPDMHGIADLGDALRPRGQADDVIPVGQLTIVDGLVCGLALSYGPPAERWGSSLIPVWEMSDRVFPPPVERYPNSVRPYLERRAEAAQRADLRARYHDFIWLRWRDHEHGRSAHDAYLEAAQTAELEGDQGAEAIGWVIRAAELSVQLNVERLATASVIRDEIRRGLNTTNLGYPCFIAEHAAKLLAIDPDGVRALVEDIEAVAAAAAEARDRWREQSLLQACTNLLRACGDSAAAAGFVHRGAASLENQARERGAAEGGLVELALLRDASRLYKGSGSSDDAQRLKADLIAAAARAGTELKRIGGTFEIPSAGVDEWASRLVAWNEENPAALLALPYELGIWVSWEAHRTFAAEIAAETPISSLVSHIVIAADGRSQPEPDDPGAKERARLVSLYARRAMIQATISGAVIERLRARQRWTPASLTGAIATVDQDLAKAASGGIRALESRDDWNAVHALVPQVERALRLIGQQVGANVVSYSTATGTSWRSMELVLGEPKVWEVLTEDVATEIDALFSNQHGPNLRNVIAHGAIEPEAIGPTHSLLAVLALLSLAAALAVARIRPGTAEGGSSEG